LRHSTPTSALLPKLLISGWEIKEKNERSKQEDKKKKRRGKEKKNPLSVVISLSVIVLKNQRYPLLLCTLQYLGSLFSA